MSVYLVEEPCPDCKPYGQGGLCAKHQRPPLGHDHSPTAQDIEVTVDMLRKVLGEPC